MDFKYKIKNLLFILIVIISLFFYENYASNEKIELRKENNKVTSKENFSIHFIDVLEGDSILINSNNEYMLIDTGKYEYKNKLLNYINNLNIKEFKYVVATHAHEDHIGTMPTIIRNYKVERFFMPNKIVNIKCFDLTLLELNKKNITYETPKIYDEFYLNDTKIKVIYINNDAEEINDTSIILKVIYKNTSFLLTGDATKNVELNVLNEDLKSDLLKVSHHGSKDATSAQFLSKVNPDYAIISVGQNNDYNHPHQITLDKLNKMNIKTYRTDLNGNIIAYSDGNEIYIETEKQ